MLRLFVNYSEKACRCIANSTLAMRDLRIKINAVAGIKNVLLVAQSNSNGSLKHHVEFLTFMSNKLCGLVIGININETDDYRSRICI